MSDDIIARAESALASVRVSGNTPIGSVPLVRDLVAELKTARAELERLRGGLARIENFARLQALSDRVRQGPAYSTHHSEERYWLDLLALIERAEANHD